MKFICGLAQQENEYVINGVKYIVGSSFMTSKVKSHPTITDRFKRIVTSDFIPLTDESPPSKMAVEYVFDCRKGGLNAVEEKRQRRHNRFILPTIP